MKANLAVVLWIVVLAAGCAKSSEAEAARAKAEADAAKAKAMADIAKHDADKAKLIADAASHEAELRRELSRDAMSRVKGKAQAMLNTAFPNAIGKVPFRSAEFEGLAGVSDGYLATVRINYTNILKDDFFMEILVSYDQHGGFRSWRIGHCNDRFPPNSRDKMFDRLVK